MPASDAGKARSQKKVTKLWWPKVVTERRSRDKISLNEMRERVAKLIFGDDWIRTLTDVEYELLRKYPLKPRKIVRKDGSTISLDHVEPYPRHLAAEIDRARGRYVRLAAQWVTIDTWLQGHGVPVGEWHGTDRKAFNAVMRVELRKIKPAQIKPKRRGPKPKILQQLITAMKDDITNRKLSLDELENMPDKELQAKYAARRERVRKARQTVVADSKNN
jgi:hypothetical protein